MLHCIVNYSTSKISYSLQEFNNSISPDLCRKCRCRYICMLHFRFMIYGVARTIHPSGPLDGLLGGRFILSFLASTFHGLAKMVTIGCVVYTMFAGSPHRRIKASVAIGLISPLFIPQFLMSIYATIGFSVNSLKTILYHIELLLLPTGIID